MGMHMSAGRCPDCGCLLAREQHSIWCNKASFMQKLSTKTVEEQDKVLCSSPGAWCQPLRYAVGRGPLTTYDVLPDQATINLVTRMLRIQKEAKK